MARDGISTDGSIGAVASRVNPGLIAPRASILLLVAGLRRFLAGASYGTAGFTPALPLLREQLVAIRAAIGLLQMTALALVPAGVLPALSRLALESHALLQ